MESWVASFNAAGKEGLDVGFAKGEAFALALAEQARCQFRRITVSAVVRFKLLPPAFSEIRNSGTSRA